MTKLLQINKSLVSVNWLYQHIDATNLIVLNGTLPKVTSQKNTQKIEENQIIGARFFDIKNVFSKKDAPFPNTLLGANAFQANARALGINKESCIVVYDEHGIYSSARVWWMFKSMGFENVAVLDGGFPAWKDANYSIEQKVNKTFDSGNFVAKYQPNKMIDYTQVLEAVKDPNQQILDARSEGRFFATAPEPRKEVRGGHIPNSKSLPYGSLLNNHQLKSKEILQELFVKKGTEEKALIFSCGSGITACVLALGATVAGYDRLAVYDGSWTEWGSLSELPIEK